MTKRLISLIIAFIAFCTSSALSVVVAYADSGAVVMQATQDIRVGYLPNYGIINEPFVRGSGGYGYEYLSEIEKASNYNFIYEAMSWAEGLERLKTGEIDMFGPASMTDERKEQYEYVESYLCDEYVNIYALEGTSIPYGEPQALNGLREGPTVVGAMEGAVYEDIFARYAEKNNISYELKYIDENKVVNSMQSGEIDVFVEGTLNYRDGLVVVDELYTESLYFITNKANTDLSQGLNDAMLQFAKEQPYTKMLLWNKYYGNTKKAPKSLTQDEKDVLHSKDVYTVGYHADLTPLSYEDKQGNPKGFAISVMDDIARYLGITIEYMPIYNNTNVDPSHFDFNLCVTSDRLKNYGHFSVPYTYSKLMALTHSNMQSVSDVKHIIAMDYSTIDTSKFLTEYENAEIHMAYNDDEATKLQKKYPSACIVALEPMAQMTLSFNPSNDYKVSFLDVSVPLGVTVSEHISKEVISALDKAIMSLNQTVVDEHIIKTLAVLQEESFIKIFFDDYGMYIAFMVLLIIAVITYLSMKKTKKHAKKLVKIVEVEPLTGLMTLHKITRELVKIQNEDKENQHAIVSFDIDSFSSINQTYGLEKGDKLLCAVANSMKKHAGDSTLISRIYDDVFLVYCDIKTATEVTGEKLGLFDEQCKQLMQAVGITIPLHLSVGVYVLQKGETITRDDVIGYISDCLGVARSISKKQYGNAVTVYTDELKQKTEREMIIYNSMEQAITNKEFYVLIQPKIELITGKLVGGEALVRWKKPDGTVVYPDEFIPLFEKNRFIPKLDKYVFEEVCQFVNQSQVALPVISVNVSPATIFDDSFITIYTDILSRYDLQPQQFELELTESVSVGDSSVIKRIGKQLREIGFKLSIDDFGKDYSSLSRIEEMVVDVIKLDKDFISENFSKDRGLIVVSNIISMAHKLDIVVLAEGIETKEQKELLIDLGCEYGQGYLFDKPLTTEDFTTRVIWDSKKSYPVAINAKEKMRTYLGDFDNLPYAFALVKNDEVYTIINGNNAFFDMIGFGREELLSGEQNSLSNILHENLSGYVSDQLSKKIYNFALDMPIVRKDGKVIWVNSSIAYDDKEDVFYVTLIDITAEKKNEEEKNLYVTLKQCIDYLYVTTTNARTDVSALQSVLEQVRSYYQADSTYYFTLSRERKEIVNSYEALQEGATSHLPEILSITYANVKVVFDQLHDGKALHINVDKQETNKFKQKYVKVLKKLGVHSLLVSPVRNKYGDIISLMLVQNPKGKADTLDLLNLLSNYVGMFINGIKVKELEKESLQLEELSKLNVMENVRSLLQTYDNIDEKIEKILDLVRVHYGAKSANILSLNEHDHTYSMISESLSEGAPSRFEHEQNQPAGTMANWQKSFGDGKTFLYRTTKNVDEHSVEGKVWEKFGISNTVIAQVYSSSSENNALLAVTNITLKKRSKALIEAVAKDIGNYLEKISLIKSREQAISIDPLSNLTNKVSTQSAIEQLLANEVTGVLFSIDLDHFKDVNDILGHSVGDSVIIEMSNEIKNTFRESDIVGRVGGDEFMVFCPNPFSMELVKLKAKSICQRCSKAYEKDGKCVFVSASVGVLCINEAGQTFSEVYDRIDKALYAAKNNGRNQYHIDNM